jgi:radical SAM superfamily enzyme YgiQ (UPF0313 family)
MKKQQILYLQLPLLDNDAKGARENFPFGAAYLDHALQNSAESAFYESRFAPTAWDELDNHHLVERILAAEIDILSCSLYLWNIERVLRLVKLLKRRKPDLLVTAGGPEVAHEHPLLFAEPVIDSIVVGEGEAVFPEILRSWRTRSLCDFDNVAEVTADGYRWGTRPAPAVDLSIAQPTAEALMACVQNRPVVYLETVRGCPLSCAYCRYYQLHTGLRTLDAEEVIARITRLREMGAKEIRFVDPTFNARKDFSGLLRALIELNTDHQLAFFAELRADTLTAEQADLMGLANFKDVEIGIQSIDPQVLKNVNRPSRLAPLQYGISALLAAKVHVTLDVMYGLPEQSMDDVCNSLDWCLAFGDGVQVQCMQTLILPGTTLREQAEQWGIKSHAAPPYGIRETRTLAPAQIEEIEVLLDENPALPSEQVTLRFCGARLAGLFKAQHRIPAHKIDANFAVPGRSNRRCLIISGRDLFERRAALSEYVRRAIAAEPDALWQFVLEPEAEEPFDLLVSLAETICSQPTHMLDRFASAIAFNQIVSRRLFVRLKTPAQFNPEWRAGADELLRSYFG